MRKVLRHISFPVLGYLCVLIGFSSLGLFVATLGFGSRWAWVIGAVMAVAFVLAAVFLRIGAVRLARSRASEDLHNVSIWAEPLGQDEVDQYYVNFRGAQPRAPRGGRRRLAASGSHRMFA